MLRQTNQNLPFPGLLAQWDPNSSDLLYEYTDKKIGYVSLSFFFYTGQRLDEDLHAATQAQHEVQGGLLRDHPVACGGGECTNG